MPDKNYLVIYNKNIITQHNSIVAQIKKARHIYLALQHQRQRPAFLRGLNGARSSALSRYRVLARLVCPSYGGRRTLPSSLYTKGSAPQKCGALPLVHSTGVEPTAFAVGGRRSIQLRYECILAPISAHKFILLFFFYRRLYENFYL